MDEENWGNYPRKYRLGFFLFFIKILAIKIPNEFKKLKILFLKDTCRLLIILLEISLETKTRIAISFFFFDLEMEFILISSLLPLDL